MEVKREMVNDLAEEEGLGELDVSFFVFWLFDVRFFFLRLFLFHFGFVLFLGVLFFALLLRDSSWTFTYFLAFFMSCCRDAVSSAIGYWLGFGVPVLLCLDLRSLVALALALALLFLGDLLACSALRLWLSFGFLHFFVCLILCYLVRHPPDRLSMSIICFCGSLLLLLVFLKNYFSPFVYSPFC